MGTTKKEAQEIFNRVSKNRILSESTSAQGAPSTGTVADDLSTKWSSGEINERVTIYLPKELERKMKFIAWHEDRAMKILFTEAVQHYVDKWEASQGKITL